MPTARRAAIFADREAGGLAGQRRAARHARIHFDHYHLAIFPGSPRIARSNRRFSTPTSRMIAAAASAHALVFLIRQRPGAGAHRNRITGVHTHRVEILDGADHHEVVAKIPHHLEFVFLPPEARILPPALRAPDSNPGA